MKLIHHLIQALKHARWRWALIIAIVSDILGFAVVMLPPVQWALDAVTVAALLWALGFRGSLFIALAIEVVPALELFPTWTLVVVTLAVAPQNSNDDK